MFVALPQPSLTTAPDLIHTSIKRIASLQKLFNTAVASAFPLVSYRLPGAAEPESCMQLDDTPLFWSEGAVDGFVVAPFDFPNTAARWLRRDLAFTGFQFNPAQARTGLLHTKQLLQLSAFYDRLAETTADNWQQLTQQPSPAVSQQNYEVQVQAALAAIARGPLQKVVLSRIKQVPLPADTHPATLFEKLCAAYPQAFVSLVNLPGLGIWLGASPELLLQNEDDMFETMSLAGTRTTAGSMAPWTDKEIHEQLLVTDYIREKLREAGLQVEVAERETVQAGQVYHLRNLIRATGHASSFALVKTLHPTPAVCGLPADSARNYLLFHEAHQRSLYGGFLGPVDAQGHSQLYVNLRSMELHKGSASLYLGGGIVAGSVPAAEWQETEHKAATLLRILQH